MKQLRAGCVSQYFQVNRVLNAVTMLLMTVPFCGSIQCRGGGNLAQHSRTNTNKKLRNVPGEPTLQTLLESLMGHLYSA